MDTVELARQLAAQLHDNAVARGLDPFKPYDFAFAEAAHHGYTVESLKPDATMLDGGRAKLLPSEELILHEDKGSRFEQALLIGHEIGHAKLGDAEDETPAKDIDFARSSEPSPVGEERVIDYGRRQRREIQMDLFARELLFPRHFARRLHVQDGLSINEIAGRLGAPFDVIAQQLLDAVLLPEVEPIVVTNKPAKPLNAEQAKAAAHRECAYLLGAGPGTGKTQTLITRVEGLVDEGVDPRRILLLTFSNKAAGEIAERIAINRPQAASALWVGTFHAFGLDLIRRFHAELGLPNDPQMIDRTRAVELLEEEFPQLGLVHYQNLYDPTQVIYDILGAISRAKDEIVGPDEYEHFSQEMLKKARSAEEVEAAEKAIEVARVYAAYEAKKRQMNLVDFGDLVWLPVKLLESRSDIKDHLASLYHYVLVDEYQDVNRSSIRLLAALRGPTGTNLWVVGDAKQSIYRFRGASSFNISRFGNADFNGGITEQLKVNYRSLEPIVEAYSEFAAGMNVSGSNGVLETDRKEAGHAPELLIASSAEEQVVALADNIETMKANGYDYRNQVVLCKGNDRLSLVGRDLERLGVPVLFLGSLFDRQEVRDLLSLLSILVDQRAMGLVRTACMPEFKMSMSDLSTTLLYLKTAELPAGEFLKKPEQIPDLSSTGVAALTCLNDALQGFGSESKPWHVLATILLERTRIAADICTDTAVNRRAQGIAIWQLMNFARIQPPGSGLPISRLLDRTRQLLRLSEDRDLRQLPLAAQGIDAVRLMTIHGSKGLEFDVVHLHGLNEDTLPGYRQAAPACPPPEGLIQGAEGSTSAILEAARIQEAECLFYVAQSRARDRLFLYAADMNRGGKSRKLSEAFLLRMGRNLKRRRASPSRSLPPHPTSENVPMTIPGGMRFEAHHVELYESCPRRFFYTHVLQTGGRRRASPFMQMHEAVRGVFKNVVSGDIGTDSSELDAKVAEALHAKGLSAHGYYSYYLDFAVAMIRYFAASREGRTYESPTALRVAFGEEEVIVRPDDIVIGKDGVKTLRRVVTRHGHKDDVKDIGATAFLLAAIAVVPGAKVELIYLADQKTYPVDLKPTEIATREKKLGEFLEKIRAGVFVEKISSRTCPNCPAFFICGPLPEGTFQPIFRKPT